MHLDIAGAILIAAIVSIDAFVSSFAYGSSKIKIPFSSVIVITLICSAVLGIAMLAGELISGYIPDHITGVISFSVLFILGIIKLLDSTTKSLIRKGNNLSREIKFSMFNFKFILSLYADPDKADIDKSKRISPTEAAALATALSLDGFAVGFGAAMGNISWVPVFFSSLVITSLAVVCGSKIGNKMARNIPFNLSWIGGVLLIGLAFLNL